MHYVDIMIIAFLEGIHSSHGHVLLNMRYNTTLTAIIGWLKPCLTGIECWIPAERSKVQRSATSLFEPWLQRGIFHKFNAALQAFEDQSASSNQEIRNDGHANDPFKLQSQYFFHEYELNDRWLKPRLTGIECWLPAKILQDQRCETCYSRLERKFLLNKIYFWTYKISISVRILNIFVRIWAQWSVDWSHVWLASSADCRREGQNLNSVLGDFLFKSASFNQAKYIFVHVNDPSELKYR